MTTAARHPRAKTALLALAVLLAAVVLRVFDANPAVAQTTVVPAWSVAAAPPLDGSSADWQSIPAIVVPLTAQQTTPPMGGGTVASVTVRAVHHGERLYVAVEWPDTTQDESSAEPETFADAAAIQFPALAGTAVPSVCMGQADSAVNIWHWRADSQFGISDMPNKGYVDLYPSTDDLFYPAREAGNPMAVVSSPVQNLVAGGFGTLTPTDAQTVEARGTHWSGRWSVVFSRPFQPSGDLQPTFSTQAAIDTAFAVWDGSLDQRNGIKSVSAFVQLAPTTEEAPRRAVPAGPDQGGYAPPSPLVTWFIVIVLAGAVLGLGWMTVRLIRRDDTA